jgi:hypothetical protein
LRQLNDRQLTNVIRQGRDLMQQDGLRGNLQRQVRANAFRHAVAERQRRQQAQQPQRQLQETRDGGGCAQVAERYSPGFCLRDPQLRNRLDEARRILRDRSLNRRLFARVRRMARLDRDELRSRIAQRDQNRTERREDRQDARQLLSDRRPASRLNDASCRRVSPRPGTC